MKDKWFVEFEMVVTDGTGLDGPRFTTKPLYIDRDKIVAIYPSYDREDECWVTTTEGVGDEETGYRVVGDVKEIINWIESRNGVREI